MLRLIAWNLTRGMDDDECLIYRSIERGRLVFKNDNKLPGT